MDNELQSYNLPVQFASTKQSHHNTNPAQQLHHRNQHTGRHNNAHHHHSKVTPNKRSYDRTQPNRSNPHNHTMHNNNNDKVWFKQSMLHDPWATLINQQQHSTNQHTAQSSVLVPSQVINTQSQYNINNQTLQNNKTNNEQIDIDKI